MNVIGYIFLGEAGEEHISVEAYKRQIEKFAAERRFGVSEIYTEEDTSLRRPFRERRVGKRLVSGLRQGDAIITVKAEWVLSSAREGLWLVQTLAGKKISLFCLDLEEDIALPGERQLMVYEGGAALIHRLLASLAACELSTHGQSIKAAKRRMKKEGKYIGGPVPFGWSVKGEYLVKDGEQQKIIRQIKKLKADRWSYRDIAVKLKDGFGVSLSHEGIRKILLKNR